MRYSFSMPTANMRRPFTVTLIPGAYGFGENDLIGSRTALSGDEMRDIVPLLRRRHQATLAVCGDPSVPQNELNPGILLVTKDTVKSIVVDDDTGAFFGNVSVVSPSVRWRSAANRGGASNATPSSKNAEAGRIPFTKASTSHRARHGSKARHHNFIAERRTTRGKVRDLK